MLCGPTAIQRVCDVEAVKPAEPPSLTSCLSFHLNFLPFIFCSYPTPPPPSTSTPYLSPSLHHVILPEDLSSSILGVRSTHGSGPGAAAGGWLGPGGHPGAAEGEAGDGRRGPREEDGAPGGGAAAPYAAGLPAQPAGHGLSGAHEPPAGCPLLHH